MHKEKSWLTCKEAADLIGCSQRTILNMIKRGDFSSEKDESGKNFIQKSEFFRVHPEAMGMETDGNGENKAGKNDLKALEERIRHLQEMVDEKKKQNEFLMGQLNINTEEKSKMLDAINSHSRLLEFKEGSGDNKNTCSSNKPFTWWPFKNR